MRDRNQDAYYDIKNKIFPDISTYMKHIVNFKGDVKCFCFVEGVNDEIFYNSFIHKKLMLQKREIHIYAVDGKDKIIKTAKLIKNEKNKLNKYAIFIIDRDYDGEKVQKENADLNNILTILPCYSIENYFFCPLENLYSLFSNVFMTPISEKRYQDFLDLLLKFQRQIALFCAIKKLTVLKNDEYLKNINSILKDYENRIDQHPLHIKEIDYKELMDEIANMSEDLRNTIKAFEQEMTKKLDSIKGKLLFSFLVKYLSSYLKGETLDQIEGQLYKLSNILKINLKPKKVQI